MLHIFLAGTIDTQLVTWGTSIRRIINIITAIFAIVGGFLVFFQYMQGNDQAQKNFIKFIIGLAIVGLVNVIVTFFLPDADTF
jgi:orotate phosphoribosyltransferase